MADKVFALTALASRADKNCVQGGANACSNRDAAVRAEAKCMQVTVMYRATM